MYWQLRTWIHDNLCYLTINCDTGHWTAFAILAMFGQIVNNDISVFDGLVLDDQKDGNDQKHAIITKEKPNKMTCQSGQCNRNNGSFWCWEWSMINCYRLEIGFVLKLLFPKFVYTDKWKDETCLLLVWMKPWLKEIGIIASTPWNAG